MKKLNPFVYEDCIAADVKFPDLPVLLVDQYAQCAEDVIVMAIIRAMLSRFRFDVSAHRYLEIGGNHPIATSSTLLLQKSFGMRGVIVEANPALINELKRVRTQDVIVHAAITPETTSTVRLSVSNANELSSLDRGFVTRWQNGEVGEKAFIEVPALRINDLIEQEFSGGGGAALSFR